MAVADGKTRVQITFSNVLLGRLDEYCERMGLSRSAFVTWAVAMNLDTYQKALSLLNSENLAAVEHGMASAVDEDFARLVASQDNG